MGLDTILEYLNWGAAGVMSLAFLMLTWLLWRRADTADKALDALSAKKETTSMLLEVVRQNTEAMRCIKDAVHENSRVIERLNLDLNKRMEELSRDMRELRDRI